MNEPHYLRFARTLALVAAASGCGARTLGDERYGLDANAPDDSGEGKPSDAVATYDSPANNIGSCRNFGTSAVPCGAGGTCVLPLNSVAPECRHDVIEARPCGAIRCGQDCFCSTTTPHACDCARAVEGPLPPPDLPVG